jgi:hypothetical protein
MKMRLLIAFFLISPVLCFTQSFGFSDDDDNSSPSLPFTFDFGGEIEAGVNLFVYDFKGENDETFSFWDTVSAKLHASIEGKNAYGYISLNFSNAAFSQFSEDTEYPPKFFDELWLRGYFDKLTVEAGLMKMRWGKMYSPGPLDVVNPLDYTDLTNLTDSKAMKIARPMIHASFNIGDFSQIEGLFIPNFTGHRFAANGRWTPSQFSNMTADFAAGIKDRAIERYSALAPIIESMYSSGVVDYSGIEPEFPDTTSIDNFQAGLRFNTVIGPADVGFQYFYGNLFRPSVSIGGVDTFIDNLIASNFPPVMPPVINIDLLSPHIEYSRYHLIGLDYSQAAAGFTLRAEVAANITEDTAGDNGQIKNPFLAWSLGFDYDIIAGININIQCNENIRLLNDGVNDNPVMDCEGGTDISYTRLVMQLSRSFFREKLNCKVITIWDVEDMDCHIIPSVSWTVNDAEIILSSGIFTGNNKGELGQYWNNSFVKLTMRYVF